MDMGIVRTDMGTTAEAMAITAEAMAITAEAMAITAEAMVITAEAMDTTAEDTVITEEAMDTTAEDMVIAIPYKNNIIPTTVGVTVREGITDAESRVTNRAVTIEADRAAIKQFAGGKSLYISFGVSESDEIVCACQ
jgi:hypothetical protein